MNLHPVSVQFLGSFLFLDFFFLDFFLLGFPA